MARPRKCRKVCQMPKYTDFAAPGGQASETIVMTLDEYETIRLIDLEGLSQEQCSLQMEVSRTTTQAIYAQARKKLAECIVSGRGLKISGGDVSFCNSQSGGCGRGCCGKKHCNLKLKEDEE